LTNQKPEPEARPPVPRGANNHGFLSSCLKYILPALAVAVIIGLFQMNGRLIRLEVTDGERLKDMVDFADRLDRIEGDMYRYGLSDD